MVIILLRLPVGKIDRRCLLANPPAGVIKSSLMTIREISVITIEKAVAELCQKANFELGADVIKALQESLDKEQSTIGREVLKNLLDNADMSRNKRVPLCQDCGAAVVFVEIGQDVHVTGGNLSKAIEQGVKKGYSEGYLRKSMVSRPFSGRANTGDNTPPVIHYEVVPGDSLRIVVMPKGGGAENMSRVSMLSPGDGEQGIINLVEETVRNAGGAPCPPLIIGIGIGGTLEKAAIMAKKALIRPVGQPGMDPEWTLLEEKILNRLNCLGIGPLGMGGCSTALAVHVLAFPCHMASLPVAVNLQCHSARHAEVVL